MIERVFRYGENNRGLGMLTVPKDEKTAPIIVLLNAGLLHRAEPYRLNVLAGRILAEIGYICLRVDISGKGDTPSRENLSNRESVALDWKFIKLALEQQFGERIIIIFGLCSGADNGIKIAAQDKAVHGLILLDAVSKKDSNFARREFVNKITNISKWIKLPIILSRRIVKKLNPSQNQSVDPTALRDLPTELDMQNCFASLVARRARVLAVFTSQALTHYNDEGQFGRAMEIQGLGQICQEIFWPNVAHLYSVQLHRDKLISKISSWGRSHLDHFRSLSQP